MAVKFTKMHGIGNDYVYVNGFEEVVRDPARLARHVSDRHFGVGGDGLILIQPPANGSGAVCRMEMYNADGSRAQMCGNGLRCVAKFAYDHILHEPRPSDMLIETDDGTKQVRVLPDERGRAAEVTVDMGVPRLERSSLPMADGRPGSEPAVEVPIEVGGHTFRITAVSMGNPHIVMRVDLDPDLPPIADIPVATWGPLFEHHVWFPERTNTEFVAMRSPTEMDFRVWERGSGETLACGTGACAAVVGGILGGWCEREALVHLRGGDLRIRWDGSDRQGHVFMTGPATEVFTGQLA